MPLFSCLKSVDKELQNSIVEYTKKLSNNHNINIYTILSEIISLGLSFNEKTGYGIKVFYNKDDLISLQCKIKSSLCYSYIVFMPYVNGKIHGIETRYNKRGNILDAIPWINNKRNGYSKKYYRAKSELLYEEIYEYYKNKKDGLCLLIEKQSESTYMTYSIKERDTDIEVFYPDGSYMLACGFTGFKTDYVYEYRKGKMQKIDHRPLYKMTSEEIEEIKRENELTEIKRDTMYKCPRKSTVMSYDDAVNFLEDMAKDYIDNNPRKSLYKME